MNTPNRNNDLQEMAHSFAETRQSYEEGFLRSTMPLESLLEQREQELLKAIEYGQNLLNRVRELEGEMHRDGEEKELVLEENEALRLRVENLEEMLEIARQERNVLHSQFKEVNEELREFRQETESQRLILSSVAEYRERNDEYSHRIEEQRDEIARLQQVIAQYQENEKFEEKKKEEKKKALKSEAEYKRQILELEQKVEKYQGERDMAHVQSRVRINELKQGIETLKESEKKLKEKLLILSQTQASATLKEEASVLKQELREMKLQYKRYSDSICGSIEEIGTVLSSITGLESDKKKQTKNSNSSNSLEMSYALLQKKIIQELGLDDFFRTFGAKSTHPSKKGWLKVYLSYFDNSKKWVEISNAGLAIFSSPEDKTPISRFSLISSKLKLSSKNKTIFEIVCDYGRDRKKTFHFTAEDEGERNEWCAFISHVLDSVS